MRLSVASSYRARRITDGGTPEARKKRRGLLQLHPVGGASYGMPVLGLLYPSAVLARDYDPVVLAGSAGADAHSVTLEVVLHEATLRLEKQLGFLTAKAKATGPEDEKWYWAAPILLDLVRRMRKRRDSGLGMQSLQNGGVEKVRATTTSS